MSDRTVYRYKDRAVCLDDGCLFHGRAHTDCYVPVELPDNAEWDAYQPRTIQEAWDEILQILRKGDEVSRA